MRILTVVLDWVVGTELTLLVKLVSRITCSF